MDTPIKQSGDGAPATSGSLSAEALADLIALRKFFETRENALELLFGRKLNRSPIRDELMRLIAIEFGFGRNRSFDFYRRTCAHVDSSSEIERELYLLEELAIVILSPSDKDRRTLLVLPSKRLIDWYSRVMPPLMEEVKLVIEARSASIGLPG